jgi:hypothetical protein
VNFCEVFARETAIDQAHFAPVRGQFCSRLWQFCHAQQPVGLLNMIATVDPRSVSLFSERDLRRQIDRSVSRALVDSEYATLLLSDPTVVLEDHGCPPQQYVRLRSIAASDLSDFARQALAHFWAAEPSRTGMAAEDPGVGLAAAAAR